MGDSLNNTLEYIELALDSWDASSAGGQFFEGSNSPTSEIQYSWPQYFFTSKKPIIAGLKVLQAEIPFVFDTITTSNNTFTYTYNGTPTTITIPPGTYNGITLAAQLQTLLTAVTAGVVVQWAPATLRFTIAQTIGTAAWSLYFASRDTAYSNLGFLPGTTYSNSGLNSAIVSVIAANVTGPYYLYVNSRTLGPLINFNLADGSATRGVGTELCRIPINVNYGSVIFYNDPAPEKFFDFFTGPQFSTFDFYLTAGSEQYQKPLDMKGTPWSIKVGLLIYRGANSDIYSKPAIMSKSGGKTVIR